MDQFAVHGADLIASGETIAALAAREETTPLYLYDRAVVDAQIQRVRDALPERVHLHYAIKANPMPELVSHIAAQVDGLDVASLGELQIAMQSGMHHANISFAGPGKRDEELNLAIETGIVIHCESPGELDRIARIGAELGVAPRVALRVNPDFELKTSGMKMSGGPKPFGIDAEQVPAVLARMAELDVQFIGFHIFSGSQNLRPESIIEAQNASFELAAKLAEVAPGPVQILNIGGGFGIPYFPGEEWLDLAPIGANLHEQLAQLPAILREAEIVVELGRYLVGPAGLYVCRVIDRKVSRGLVYLVTDGGLHHHLAASGNFGQVIRKNYPVAIANRMDSTERETVSIVGPLCTPLDLLADRMELPQAEPGDLVVIYQSGAYGYSASPRAFLSHPDATERLI